MMLNENLKAVRKSKGLSQEELAIKLNVVRQTISKWEKGLSVPDSEMLIKISDVLETPVSVLLGETIAEKNVDEWKVISEKLEIINLQLARRQNFNRKVFQGILITICVCIVLIFVGLILIGSPYLEWDYSDPERAVVGVALHAFEWIFVRFAPVIFVAAIVGIILLHKKRE